MPFPARRVAARNKFPISRGQDPLIQSERLYLKYVYDNLHISNICILCPAHARTHKFYVLYIVARGIVFPISIDLDK